MEIKKIDFDDAFEIFWLYRDRNEKWLRFPLVFVSVTFLGFKVMARKVKNWEPQKTKVLFGKP